MSARPVRRTRVKMCGMMDADDIAMAVDAGADAIGVITARSSPRCVVPNLVYDTGMPNVVTQMHGLLRALRGTVPPFVTPVAVVTGPNDRETSVLQTIGFTLQFSGQELPEQCERQAAGAPYLKAFHLREGVAYDAADFDELEAYTHARWMFDSRVGDRLGGTGVPFHWGPVRSVAARRPIVVSGGLTPENVADCVRLVRPFAVDVRSGIETDGKKDLEKMHAFVRAVREADASD